MAKKFQSTNKIAQKAEHNASLALADWRCDRSVK
jgi:hypothetical protein